ncbi:transposable element Tcb1 transposase [Trichonephila clavipes]|nr:transposable element Tcb1 transposase [Trichonephila clavipes]
MRMIPQQQSSLCCSRKSRFNGVEYATKRCFLWDYVKSLVYADKPQTLDHLEDNIRRVIADIRLQMLEKVIENWTSRLDYIRASRDSPMPQIIFKMNGGKEVKLFTRALKAFECNNRIVMAQRKHLDDFLRGGIIGRLECGRTQLEVSEELGIAQSFISRLRQRFQDDDNGTFFLYARRPVRCVPLTATHCRLRLIWRAPSTRYHQENTIERHCYGVAGWLVWGGIIFGYRTDLHVQSVTMIVHIYRDFILEQHVRLFRGAICAEFLFMDENARPHRANIVDECLQS